MPDRKAWTWCPEHQAQYAPDRPGANGPNVLRCSTCGRETTWADAAPSNPQGRLSEIRARLDAAEAKDRPDCGPYTFTPEGGTDDHRLARIWGPDGDCLAEVHGNLGLDIDGDALADLWAHANVDLAWLLGEVDRLEHELAGAGCTLCVG